LRIRVHEHPHLRPERRWGAAEVSLVVAAITGVIVGAIALGNVAAWLLGPAGLRPVLGRGGWTLSVANFVGIGSGLVLGAVGLGARRVARLWERRRLSE